MRRQPLKIRLGADWSFFAQYTPDTRLIGTEQDGMQIGALAQSIDGRYLQINGDVHRTLNSSRVEHALDRATGTARKAAPIAASVTRAQSKPTVTIKKRRKVNLEAGS